MAALEMFGAPDVIIADYHFDSGNGVAAIRAVRERFGRSISAILATADRALRWVMRRRGRTRS